MKTPIVINACALALIACSIGYSVLRLSHNDPAVVGAVQRGVTDLRRHEAELVREFLTFSGSYRSDHDLIGKHASRLNDATTTLRGALAANVGIDSTVNADLSWVCDDATELAALVERLRSQTTIQRNALATFPKLIDELLSTSSPPAGLSDSLGELASLIASLTGPGFERACLTLEGIAQAIDDDIASPDRPHRERWRLARAQARQLVASTRFLRRDSARLFRMTNDPQRQARIDAVQTWVHDCSKEVSQAINLLVVASAALLAFVSAGVWQFRNQARQLATINAELEERVTDRTKELSRSQEFLETVIDSLPSRIGILDRDGVIISTNALWDRFVTDDESDRCGVGEDYLASCRNASGEGAGDLSRLAAAIVEVAHGRMPCYEAEYARQSASDQRWYQVTVTPLPNSVDGEVVVAHTSITERVTAQQQMERHKAEAEQLALVARHTVNAVVIADADRRIEWVNPSFTRMTGYSPDDAIGESLETFLQGEVTDPVAASTVRERLSQERGFDAELVNRTKAGDEYWASIEVSPINDDHDRVRRYIVIQSDVTQRKRFETELQDLNDRLAEQNDSLTAKRRLLDTIVNTVPQAIFWKDTESTYLGCNHAFADAADLKSTSDIQGKTDYDLPWTPEQADQYRDTDSRVMRREMEFLNWEEAVTTADGRDRIVWTSKRPLEDDDGAIVGLVGVFNDVSEKKALERQLAQAKKLESLGELSAGLAHEINTPMQFVGDNIEFLNEAIARLVRVVDLYQKTLFERDERSWAQRREDVTRVAEECRFEHIREQVPEAIAECREGVRRTVKIVKAMKTFSHPGSESIAMVNLNEAIESTIAVSRNRWKYVAELVTELDPDLPDAALHAAEVNQVLLNLVVNAADAVAEKHEGSQLGRIVVRTKTAGDAVQVEVEDDGCGVPEEIREMIFDQFVTTKEVGQGTGQGLAIAHNVVVKLHGGEIELESEPGAGALFRITLPIDSAEIDGAGETPTRAQAEPSGALS